MQGGVGAGQYYSESLNHNSSSEGNYFCLEENSWWAPGDRKGGSSQPGPQGQWLA